MSEQLLSNSPELTVETPTTVSRAETPVYSEAERTKHLEQAKAAVTAESARTKTTLPKVDDRPQLIDSSVKQLRLRQNIAQVRGRMKPSEQAFSKVIHQPLVSIVSTAAAQTVTRPSGMLGGGVAAFVGSLVYLLLARYIGFSYNYLLFTVFFVGGFGLGVLGEYTAYWLRRAAR